ncbi:hypothetical protein JFV30_01420 [Pseudomonas sp. TH32]|uniref:hypothetical protein n=1 Tax=Pseudomonas sp. TH32 TaxID=2796397 RepID=UPI00191264A2|nr:hypothetical protein [Pseudomonas sp. TH32]MBK5435553.1 hypothetical protein [Pseudomonas sp. TH32]
MNIGGIGGFGGGSGLGDFGNMVGSGVEGGQQGKMNPEEMKRLLEQLLAAAGGRAALREVVAVGVAIRAPWISSSQTSRT